MNNKLFESALSFVLKCEGGYADIPDDKGGPTNKGICQKTYDSYNLSKKIPAKHVKNITDKEIRDIYYNNYWKDCNCDDMHPVFAILVFDTAVNMGKLRAFEFLNAAKWQNSDKFLLARIKKYVAFAKKPSQRKFLLGWLNRVFDLIDFVNGTYLND
ncbi:MAG: glycosyl hydrolase 108 family protein [Candidatus Gastranaerophilales bacterium]|nr:glycosyl hydrolase 108 family protein [Candidatus Gastranaerophilales bacterium]